MIDTKLYEELVSKRAELKAEVEVCRTMFDFANSNANRCKIERNFNECQAWCDVMKDINAKMERVHSEYEDLIKRVKEL